MDSEKIIGYFLLAAGVLIILTSTYSVYRVFTGQQKPPGVFSVKVPSLSLPASQMDRVELPEGMELPEGFPLPQTFSPELKTEEMEMKLLPDELVNGLVNMSVYFLLMVFVASSGAKIASIGVKMIKDIKVVVKEDKIKRAVGQVESG